MIKRPVTISFQKYDSTPKEIKSGKVKASEEKKGTESNVLEFITDL